MQENTVTNATAEVLIVTNDVFFICKSAIKGTGQKKLNRQSAETQVWSPLSWSGAPVSVQQRYIKHDHLRNDRENPACETIWRLFIVPLCDPARTQPTPSVCSGVAYVEKSHLQRREACDGSWSTAWMFCFTHGSVVICAPLAGAALSCSREGKDVVFRYQFDNNEMLAEVFKCLIL